MLLDLDEGAHGVLYVANTGRPFTDRNFKAICELAQSDKAPDESIGNKGVGFKSVLQVCEWPEIYSASQIGDDRFGGYCFTFARLEQYDELAAGDTSLADEMRKDVAPYFLPVPLDKQPARVSEFARSGMATVVRLPIKSDTARGVAIERVGRLRDEEVPVQLFLERLGSLEIASFGGAEDAPAIPYPQHQSPPPTLTRDSLSIDDPAADPEQRYEYVDLASQGTWFISSRRMPAEQMRAAIAESVEEGQLDDSWSGWSSDAWVSVAVRLDGSEVQPRLYTFLPMEREAEAPLHGHLHAPFSTMLARTAASDQVTLNARLLDVGARAAAAAVLTFRDNDDVLPEVALVDLLAWDVNHFDRVTESFETALGDVEPTELEVVPTEPLPDGRRRGALTSTYRWDGEELSLLDRARLARDAGAELVSDAIDGPRLDRLDAYCRSFFHIGLDPGSELRAEWIESVAGELHARAARPRTWDRFYSEVALVLEDDPDALRGRKVLLGADGKLHAPPPDDDDEEAAEHPFVFFPPARERTDEDDEVEGDVDLKPPVALQRALVLMSEDLTWTRQEGRTRRTTPARKFLEHNKLVRRFKTVDLLEHVGRALQRDRRATLAADALRFAYRLYTGTRRSSDLKGLDLRVPTRGGWRPAREAAFSPKWGTPSLWPARRARGSRGRAVVEPRRTRGLAPQGSRRGSRNRGRHQGLACLPIGDWSARRRLATHGTPRSRLARRWHVDAATARAPLSAFGSGYGALGRRGGSDAQLGAESPLYALSTQGGSRADPWAVGLRRLRSPDANAVRRARSCRPSRVAGRGARHRVVPLQSPASARRAPVAQPDHVFPRGCAVGAGQRSGAATGGVGCRPGEASFYAEARGKSLPISAR